MRTRGLGWIALAALATLPAAGGCYRMRQGGAAGSATASPAARPSTLAQALERARVRGLKQPLAIEGYRVSRLGDGLRVERISTEFEPRVPVRGVSDSWITTKVKSSLLQLGFLDMTRIHVDTYDGDVALRGQVGSADEAARAIKVALGISGVNAVDSRLTWR